MARTTAKKAFWAPSTALIGGLTLRCAKCHYGRFKIRYLNRRVLMRCGCGVELEPEEFKKIEQEGPTQEDKLKGKQKKAGMQAPPPQSHKSEEELDAEAEDDDDPNLN